MASPLRVLMLEDSIDDADLVLMELRRGGYEPSYERVDTEAGLRALLTKGGWEIVLSDYSMPAFDALRALAVVRETLADIPFIVISGTIGEETAVEVMRRGANDYLLKGQLTRLTAAVARELREAKARAATRAAERARKAAEASFTLIVERSPDLVVVHRDGRIVYANPTALATLGYAAAKEKLVGAPREWVVVEDPSRAGADGRWRRAGGGTLPVEVVQQSIAFEGEPATVEIARDLTERNQIATAMVEMDRMASIGTLAAAVGHEINNPLAYVLANLEFVTSEVDAMIAELPPEAMDRLGRERVADVAQALADTTHGALRMRDIVQDLRTFSRGDDQTVALVDPRQVLESSLRMAHVQLRQRATVTKDYREVPLVLANDSRLGQVFLNLIVNAAHALPEGRPKENRITLTTREDDGDAIVSIADTGPGIPPEILPRIFEPFFTTKPAGMGTGLGLAICKRILGLLGGALEVETSPKGTTFSVRIPRADTRAPRAAHEPPRTPHPTRRGRVLCVDDEPAIGLALRRVLVQEHDVMVVTSAQNARERIKEGERFDVILCDLMMPDMSGMDLHAELASLAPDQAARMVFVSGGAFTPQARDFLDSIENRRFVKPLGIDQLRTTICELIDAPA